MKIWLCSILLFLLPITCELQNSTDQCPNVKTSIASIRKRRHLTFPDGYNIILTISLVKAFLTHAPSGWNLALEIDVLYALPDANFTNAHFRRKLHHRQKREFWERIKTAFDFHNLNGRACIVRSICEANEYLAPPGKSLVHDILRALFTAPLHEEEFRNEVGGYYDELYESNFCDRTEECPLSLLNFILSLNKLQY